MKGDKSRANEANKYILIQLPFTRTAIVINEHAHTQRHELTRQYLN